MILDLRNLPTRQMTREETEAFLTLMMITKNEAGEDLPDDSIEQILDGLVSFKIITGRLKAVYPDVKVATHRCISICCALADNPGICVMWAYLLAVMRKELGRAVTDDDLFTSGPFGLGVPSKESFRQVWLSQKDGGNNKLDTRAPWPILP